MWNPQMTLNTAMPKAKHSGSWEVFDMITDKETKNIGVQAHY